MADGSGTVIELTMDSEDKPLIHVLRYAGTTKDQIDVFRTVTFVMPDANNNTDDDGTVYYMPCNSKGVPFVDASGMIPIFPTPPMQVGPFADPNAMLSRADIVEKSGLSLSTVKRAEKDGSLGPATRISERRVAYPQEQVRAWWDAHNRKTQQKA